LEGDCRPVHHEGGCGFLGHSTRYGPRCLSAPPERLQTLAACEVETWVRTIVGSKSEFTRNGTNEANSASRYSNCVGVAVNQSVNEQSTTFNLTGKSQGRTSGSGGADEGISERKTITNKTLFSLSNNSNIPVNPWALVLHTRRITSTIPEQSNSMDGTKYESESCEYYPTDSPSIGIRDAGGSHDSIFVRKGSTSAESLLPLTPARSCVNPDRQPPC
jgi:hypothetical protein